MFKLPLQHMRRIVRSPVYLPKRGLESSSAADRTKYVNQAVNELQAAQRTTNTSRIVNKICQRLAKDRATTRTEQLIWLARYSLDASAAHKRNVDGDGKPAAEEKSKVADDGKQTTTCEEDDGQAWEAASVKVGSFPGSARPRIGHGKGSQWLWSDVSGVIGSPRGRGV
ncbi:hypothetical protein P3342_013417 [Pyrenophora teres f. teres]|nr:hypothetical protein P3342_013417 [Pyrenophora teres f. teres]